MSPKTSGLLSLISVRRLVAQFRTFRAAGLRELLRPSRWWMIHSVATNTLLPHRRLSHLADLAMSAPDGAIVECGSYLGGAAALMALSCPEREVWLFDSWEGCPEPTELDVNWIGTAGRPGDFSASEHETKVFLYDTLGFSPNRVKMVKGWFSETLDGAMEGIEWYLSPDFSKVDGKVVLAALGQAFFSLSVGWGLMITYGSYMPKSQNIISNGFWVAMTKNGFGSA